MSFLDTIPLYCVDCGSLLHDSLCGSCGRQFSEDAGVPRYFSRQDEQSAMFLRYVDNYIAIANDDLEKSILSPEYKRAQVGKLLGYCGDKIQGDVLDLGAGQGDFLKQVDHGRKIGVDVSTPCLKLLQQSGIVAIQANAENLPFRDAFDLIVTTDVLEHVLHPEQVMQSIFRAAKHGARVVIRVPYKEEDLSQYTPEKGCKYEFVHLRTFDEDVLRHYMEQAGLELVQFHYDGWSMNRIRPKVSGALSQLLHWCTVKYYRHRLKRVKVSEVDSVFAFWPEWVGRRVFEPYELVAIARVSKTR